ncbi:hypothetical protein [Kitasatospora sp. NPDC127116]|uniref:hypothetical protein n=1 Tax=unclassified Kitasatospora TaxID=2633591 RepID=UPI0036320F29
MKLRTVLAGLLFGVCACTGVPGGHGAVSDAVVASGAAAAGPSAAAGGGSPELTVPEDSRRQILRLAEENGNAPAGGAFTVVRYDSGYGPELIWQAETTGAICSASPRVVSRGCVPLADIAARPLPGVGIFIGASMYNGQWSVMLMSSGETIDQISCQGRSFPARKGYSITVDGVLRTVYTVSVPRSLQGEYRVAVQRDGAVAEDRVTLDMGNVGDRVQC